MAQTIIGITCCQRPDGPEKRPMAYIPSGYPNGVRLAGGLPLLLPLGDVNQDEIRQLIGMVDKLLLTGGDDVSPDFYGEQNLSGADNFSRQRDLFEMALAEEAMRQGKPIFAICRGMQLYNVLKGGSLHQNIANHDTRQIMHPLVVENDSVLSTIYGSQGQVNTYHHQSIKVLGQGLVQVAYDPRDRTIEAVRDKDYPAFLGVQWHPDVEPEKYPDARALFDYFVNDL